MTRLLIAGLMVAVAVPALAAAPSPMPSMGGAMRHDRVMTRAEVQGHVAQMFARLDTNRDGVVTKAEADAARQAMAGKRKDHRGEKAMVPMGAKHRDPAAAFDRIDANRDGMISRDEFTRAHAIRDQRMAGMKGMGGMGGKMFGMADANRDGRVTPEERAAARQRMMGAKKGR